MSPIETADANVLYRPARPRLTRAGLAYVLVALCILGAALLQQANLLFFLFAWLLAPALLSVWLCGGNLKCLRAVRRMPEEAFAGQPLRVELEVQNDRKSGTAYCLWISDHRDAQLGQPSARCGVRDVAPGGRERARYSLTPPRRGRFGFATLTIDSTFPLGLFSRAITIAAADELIVCPALGTLSNHWHAAWGQAAAISDQRQSAIGRNQEHYHALREFRDGDNSRHIHWRTSARRGELMIKEFEAERDRRLLLIVDPWQPANATAQQQATLELVLSFAATACVAAARRGDCQLELWIAEGGHIDSDSGASQHLLDVLQRLALVAGASETGLAATLKNLHGGSNGQRAAWIVSTRPLADCGPELKRQLSEIAPDIHFIDASSGGLTEFFSLNPPTNPREMP